MRYARILACTIAISFVSGCAIGPNYQKPEVEVPAAYKELEGWKIAEPKDAMPKGKWWAIFKDPILDELMEQVSVSNQELRAAEARYAQARSQVSVARSALFPTLGASANADRARRGDGQTLNTVVVTLDAGWEIDLWGRVRRTVEAADAGAQASAADLEAVRLLLQAELATSYFQIRVLDVGRELLEDAAKNYERSYQLTRNRYDAGVVSKADVVQAEAQLRSTQAQEIDLRITRATLENGIAVLIGKPPATFKLALVPFKVAMPEVPPGIPSTLLERRPDIAAAERRMVIANARIGVAQAAYFPSLNLDARLGFTSNTFSNLFTLPNRTWSLGAGLAGTIIDFGARSGQVSAAEAAYDEAVANYRQTVLTGFQEVENNLATLHWLGEESKVQLEATRAARESVVLTTNQYKAGTVSFLNVVIVQAAQLNEERTMVGIVGRRLAATIGLVRALGGNVVASAVDMANLAQYREWIGRTDVRQDVVTAAPLVSLSALLDRDDPAPMPGDPTPPLAHWLYFLPNYRQSNMDVDGHALKGTFLPPVPLPRRMWAGSRLEFLRPMRVGSRIARLSRITDVVPKEGRSGALVFVTVRHEVSDEEGLVITDEHDIVFRGQPPRGQDRTSESALANAPKPAPSDEAWRREIHPDPVLLFRYSAVTFNSHRIHYDQPYVTGVEGYPGLVVHGPLTATLLVDLFRRSRPGVAMRTFTFRAQRPLYDTANFWTCGQPDEAARSARLWTRDAEGAVTMDATATW